MVSKTKFTFFWFVFVFMQPQPSISWAQGMHTHFYPVFYDPCGFNQIGQCSFVRIVSNDDFLTGMSKERVFVPNNPSTVFKVKYELEWSHNFISKTSTDLQKIVREGSIRILDGDQEMYLHDPDWRFEMDENNLSLSVKSAYFRCFAPEMEGGLPSWRSDPSCSKASSSIPKPLVFEFPIINHELQFESCDTLNECWAGHKPPMRCKSCSEGAHWAEDPSCVSKPFLNRTEQYELNHADQAEQTDEFLDEREAAKDAAFRLREAQAEIKNLSKPSIQDRSNPEGCKCHLLDRVNHRGKPVRGVIVQDCESEKLFRPGHSSNCEVKPEFLSSSDEIPTTQCVLNYYEDLGNGKMGAFVFRLDAPCQDWTQNLTQMVSGDSGPAACEVILKPHQEVIETIQRNVDKKNASPFY